MSGYEQSRITWIEITNLKFKKNELAPILIVVSFGSLSDAQERPDPITRISKSFGQFKSRVRFDRVVRLRRANQIVLYASDEGLKQNLCQYCKRKIDDIYNDGA